jgi:hypothetical protein
LGGTLDHSSSTLFLRCVNAGQKVIQLIGLFSKWLLPAARRI